ncbi:MAG: cation:proton antiporter [Pseudomonadota bacterium]
MDIQLIVVAFAAIGVILIAAQWLAPLIRLPTPTMQLLLGVVITNAVVAAGIDTGLRFDNFHDLVFYLFLPLLVYTAAWAVDVDELKKNLLGIAALALLGLLITTFLTATVLYYAIAHPTGFPWTAALLAGALLAATDPAAVTSQSWVHHVRPKLALLLEGESLFNDATAVVLFTVILGVATATSPTLVSTSQLLGGAALTFVLELAGGAVVGSVTGSIARLVLRKATHNIKLWLGLSLALGAYHISLSLHASGVIACLILGLMLGKNSKTDSQAATTWDFVGQTTNGMLFVLMGATLTWSMFAERWLAMLLAIGAVVLSRFISVCFVLAPQNRFLASPYSWSDIRMTGFLGMRGAITIALVLVLPVELPYWWTIQSIAYGVVLYDLLITAPLMPLILKPKV